MPGLAAQPSGRTLTPAQLEARAEGRRRLRAMRRRTRRIRVWVCCAAVIVFVALFATVYVRMSQGLDPALGASATQAVSTQTSSAATPSDATTSDATTSDATSSGSSSSESSSSTSDSSSSSAGSVAPVTTSQS